MGFLRIKLSSEDLISLENLLNDAVGNYPRKPVDILELSARAMQILRQERITTIEQLMAISGDDLLKIPGFGQKTLKLVNNLLTPYRSGEKRVYYMPGEENEDHY